jgi:predicted PurR-regulated permease PerM
MADDVKGRTKVPALLMLASFVVVVAGMRAAASILVPFLLAVFIAVICAPPFFWLQRRGLPKILALVFILAAIVATGMLVGVLIGPSLNQFLRSIPGHQARLSAYVAALADWLVERGLEVSVEDIRSVFNFGWIMNLAGEILSTLSSLLTNTFLILLAVVFILLEAADLPKKLKFVLRDPDRSLSAIEKFSRSANRYLVIKTLVSAGTGLLIGLWLSILGADYPVLWGTLAFLLNYVPNIGSIIAAVPAVLVVLLQLGAASAILAILGYVTVNVVISNILEPKLMGRGLSLSTLVVFLSLVFWGWVLGPLGMILSVPITSLVKIALESSEDTKRFANMLGSGTGG